MNDGLGLLLPPEQRWRPAESRSGLPATANGSRYAWLALDKCEILTSLIHLGWSYRASHELDSRGREFLTSLMCNASVGNGVSVP